jgi:hypothetical protein
MIVATFKPDTQSSQRVVKHWQSLTPAGAPAEISTPRIVYSKEDVQIDAIDDFHRRTGSCYSASTDNLKLAYF